MTDQSAVFDERGDESEEIDGDPSSLDISREEARQTFDVAKRFSDMANNERLLFKGLRISKGIRRKRNTDD